MVPVDQRTYKVEGTSCGHCVSSVSTEVAKVAGVRDVEVDLGTGAVTVSGEGIEDADVRTAITEAGYNVVPAEA